MPAPDESPSPDASPLRTVGGLYLVLQGVAGAVWWILILTSPRIRDLFQPAGSPHWTLTSFWLADLSIYVVGSVLAGGLLLRGSSRARPALWFVAGAVAYATLWCVGLTALTGGAWPTTGLMLGSLAATLWVTWQFGSPVA